MHKINYYYSITLICVVQGMDRVVILVVNHSMLKYVCALHYPQSFVV